MKRFLTGFILACGIMFNFNVVSHCLTPQTKESVYLPMQEDSYIVKEIEQKVKSVPNVELAENWHAKSMVFKKIVDTSPLRGDRRTDFLAPQPPRATIREVVPSFSVSRTDDESSSAVFINAILQREKIHFNCSYKK